MPIYIYVYISPRINFLKYFDSIPEEKLRVTKPGLSPGSQRILLDPGIFKMSILPFHKN